MWVEPDEAWRSARADDEARAQHVVYTTKDLEEGIRAFPERREPRFTGR